MSKLIAMLLIVPTLVFAQDRKYNHTITQTTNTVISKEANYKETIEKDALGNRVCVVTVDVEITGVWQKARGSYTWDGGALDNKACVIAAMQARKNLTAEVKPSIISSKAEIVYEENSNTKRVDGYRKGDIVDVANLHPNPMYPKSFAYNGSECKRYFEIKKGEKGIKQYNLIACKLSNGWLVEDIF
jgi:hypothetical protein